MPCDQLSEEYYCIKSQVASTDVSLFERVDRTLLSSFSAISIKLTILFTQIIVRVKYEKAYRRN